MEEKKITGVLLDVNTQRVKPVTVNDDLQEYYKILGCDLIEIVARKIAGRTFLIVCDEEGTLKEKPVISGLDTGFHPALVGSLFICKPGEDGELGSLETEDVYFIKDFIQRIPAFFVGYRNDMSDAYVLCGLENVM